MSETSSGGVRRGAALMASGTATSRMLGLLRQMVLASAIGATGQAADAFSVANKLPNILYMLLAGGVLNAVLVPQVVQAYRRKAGQEYVDRLLTFGFAVLAGVTLVLTLCAPLLVHLYAKGFTSAQLDLATAFAFWCVPQMFFYGMYALLGQVLNARSSFGPYMWAPVVNNIVSIAGFAVFIAMFGAAKAGPGGIEVAANWTTGQTTLLAGSATLGVIAQAVVLIPALRASGVRARVRWGLRGSGLGRAGKVASWTLVGLTIGQLGYIVVSNVAADAPGAAGGGVVAGNAAYDWAFLIFMLPHSLVTVSLATALFTRLSGQAHEKDVDGVRATLSSGLRVVGLFTVLATAVVAVLAVPITQILLWTSSDAQVHAVSPVVVTMIVGLPAFGAWSMCQRVYYAYEDARGMVPIQIVMAVVVVGGTLLGRNLLEPRSWVAGAGLAMSVSYLVGAVLGLWMLRGRLRTLDGPRVLRVHVQALLAGAVAAGFGLVALVVLRAVLSGGNIAAIIECVVVGTVMGLAYLAALRLMRVSELDTLMGPLLAKVRGRASRLHTGNRPPGGPVDAGGAVSEVVGRGAVLSGRYRVVQPAESDLPGATAWQATDQILDRPVRVHVLSSGHISQGLDGARRAALVTDARLVRVLDVGTHEGHGYVVSEQVTGPSLADLLARGPLTADQARAIAGEAAAALEVARRRGVHHLALRPSSLHVTDDGRIVVSGLGLDAGLLGIVARDAHTTTRADTVGLVRVLYAALTGHWPADPSLPSFGVDLPEAPTVDGLPVPPAELVADVPGDLDTLCAVTLGPNDDGPHSPGELVRELEPWGAIRAVQVATGPVPVVAAPEAPAVPADDDFDVDDMEDTAPIAVQRESIRTSYDAQPPPAGVNRPGTPPPAAPTRTSAFGAAGAVGAAATARAWNDEPPGDPSPAPEPAPTLVGGFDFDRIVEEQEYDTEPRRRFNPTALVLVLVGIAVVIGVVFAFKALFSSLDTGAPAPSPSTSTSASPEPTSDEPSSPSPEPSSPAESTVPPVIGSATSVDPSDDDGEHEEAVDRAFDGDPSTYWYTMTYKRADFAGFKNGVGYVMKLEDPTTVHTVTLHANGSGGHVEIRATGKSDPSGGKLLAEGEFGSEVTFTLDPATETEELTLWITELPTASDGSFRLELNEIELS
ncbi:murein biosynthesis integral membrane protein MurJ [Cellulomonas sp. PhB150]|uniref:murein biosynthesis integral membrane protein MurJ n=1 Tax=Cellulomonas sp. PhB150 TaxID=2485188 RepID=UPI000FA6C56D|nr:murein biosynthesis integral membrane protein MurJ [Cellulomonas sp. PhB150]ROS26243.1 murein biosynthesis integral membrane protein MurJ [Cellulomonas sp. PhB150]